MAALHEAAHAVLAEHVGIPVERVSLLIEPSGDTACTVGGVTRFHDLQWNESDTPAVMRALLLVAVAGDALENVLGLAPSEYYELGVRTIEGKTRPTDLSRAHEHLDEIARHHGVAWTSGERDTLVAAATTRAEAFVRQHLPAIEAVGNALLLKAKALLLAPNAPVPSNWRVSIGGDELQSLLDRPAVAGDSLASRIASAG